MDVLNRIQRRFIWVVLLTVIGLGGGVAYSYMTGGGYNATARLFVGTTAHDAIEAAQGDLAGQQRVKTYQVLATGADLLERAANRSRSGISGVALKDQTTVVFYPGTVLLAIRVNADDPNVAAAEADAVAVELADLVMRVETPIDGGQPALTLVTVQSAASGVAETERFDYKKVVLGGGLGLVIGLLLTGFVPERDELSGARHQRYGANEAQERGGHRSAEGALVASNNVEDTRAVQPVMASTPEEGQ